LSKIKQKLLLTGFTGFIGSELLPKLVEEYDVYTLERYVTGRYGEPKNYKVIFGNLIDSHLIANMIKHVQPDYVIHLAAITAVSYSYDHPVEVIENNLFGTINLAESCLRYIPHFKQFINASSVEVYGNNGFTIQKETNPLMPASPYAVSKMGGEKYLEYLNEAYDFPYTIMRPANTYGRKKDYHFLIEKTIVHMLTRDKILLGDPDAVRDWMHVSDHVNAYLTCLGNEKAMGEIFNFSTGEALDIRETIGLIKELVGFKGRVYYNAIPARPTESKIIRIDSSKARSLLGWKTDVDLLTGLVKTVEYWKEHLKC